MHFGKFLFALMSDLGITPAEMARVADVEPRTVYRWRDAPKLPRGGALSRIVDALQIPVDVFREAAIGKTPLPKEYRDRHRWKHRRDLEASTQGTSFAAPIASQVVGWFMTDAPKAVQHAILGNVPEGMEEEYLQHVTDYFRRRLMPRQPLKK